MIIFPRASFRTSVVFSSVYMKGDAPCVPEMFFKGKFLRIAMTTVYLQELRIA